MFLDEYRARRPEVVAGSAAQIPTILSTGKYVSVRLERPAGIGCQWRSDVFGIATQISNVLLKCDRYDRNIVP